MNVMMNLAFICDENYVLPTIVAIKSLKQNKDLDSAYKIHVLASDITEKSRKLLCSLAEDSIIIDILDLSQSEIIRKCRIEGLHVSTAALYKFSIAELFPEIDKMLYLDGDVLIQKDLKELYKTNIENVYAAVVKDYKPTIYKPSQMEKLGVNHTAYFNSGVMLLNLKKLREDNLKNKLLQYRLNGINYFMDQDALNVVFGEQVKYLSLLYNLMSSVVGFFSVKELVDYYEVDTVITQKDFFKQATILHLCTKYKPWEYSNVPFADEWMHYWELMGDRGLERKILGDEEKEKTFSKLIEHKKGDFGIDDEVIISLTSFPARIRFVSEVIKSLLRQTVMADKIFLWLAKSQFPNMERDLPENLVEMSRENDIFKIKWCDDLRPHKKYYYTMKENPDSVVITVDDDVYYSERLVEELLVSYTRFPFAVSAKRAHMMTVSADKEIAPYAEWKRGFDIEGYPSMLLCATGVGGVLYPPHCMPEELFNKEKIIQLCLDADDLWLKVMQLINNTPVVVAEGERYFQQIENSQDIALWKSNDLDNKNDYQLKQLLDHYNEFVSEKDTLSDRLSRGLNGIIEVSNNSSLFKRSLEKKEEEKNRKLKLEIAAIHQSATYRIGRAITFIPRMIRGMVLCYKEHGIRYTFRRIKIKLKIGVRNSD